MLQVVSVTASVGDVVSRYPDSRLPKSSLHWRVTAPTRREEAFSRAAYSGVLTRDYRPVQRSESGGPTSSK
jgi:hypothetical protein